MSLYKNLFKQTVIYGIATVLPKMFSFILVPIYTKYLPVQEYGEISVLFSLMMFFNIVLAYGMETTFFRFYHSAQDKEKITDTSLLSIFLTSTFFLLVALLNKTMLAEFLNKRVEYITYSIWILFFDALVIIPFSKLRALQKPINYATIKILNVIINLGITLFLLLYLPFIVERDPDSFVNILYIENFQVGYIFIANGVASFVTFLILLPHYFHFQWGFDFRIWKRMINYGFPVMLAGIAFAINEHFDKILLEWLLPKDVAEEQVGIYAACYKLSVFMVLFSTAFRLGIEPFFFSYSKNKDASKTYALITKYFVVFGSLILLVVIVFIDVLKILLIKNSIYWEAMQVVPVIILANFFLGIYNNLSVWYKVVDKTKVGAYISIVGASITLVINFLLIPIWGYVGSAVATIVAYASMMVISYLLGNQYYPIPYDLKKIGAYLVLSVIFSMVSFYMFRENYFVGISFLFLFLFFIYYNEKEMLQRILKKIPEK